MSLLEKLKRGTSNKKTIKFPGTETDIVIRVLSEADRQDAQFAAEHHFENNKIEISMATVEAYESEKTLQMIYRALSDTDGNRIARNIDEFRKSLTLDEKNALVDAYLAHEKECSPDIDTMSEDDFNTLLQNLKKSPKMISSVLSINTARRLISSLVDQLATFQQGSGSIS